MRGVVDRELGARADVGGGDEGEVGLRELGDGIPDDGVDLRVRGAGVAGGGGVRWVRWERRGGVSGLLDETRPVAWGRVSDDVGKWGSGENLRRGRARWLFRGDRGTVERLKTRGR